MNKYLLLCALAALAACTRSEFVNTTTPAAAITPAKVNVPAGAYTLDKAHSTITFHLHHMGFSQYVARFVTFDTQLQFDPANLAASTLAVNIDPHSLDLNNPPEGFKDSLLGPDWLDAAKYPQMTFRSTAIELTGPTTMRVNGDLTLHGVTHPVTLDTTFNGGYAGQPMDPHARIGFSAQGSFKRSDFGISAGIPAPGTTMGVGDTVNVQIEMELSGPPLATTPATQG